ncbi:MAG: hypothetical protein ACLQAL_01725, partial [Halobacteriota archaeon]
RLTELCISHKLDLKYRNKAIKLVIGFNSKIESAYSDVKYEKWKLSCDFRRCFDPLVEGMLATV